MTYGTLINNTLNPAPRAIRIGGAVVCNPTAAQYAQAGYYPIVDERPTCADGYHAVAVGWETRDGAIHRVYEAVQDPPPPPRSWTPLAIKRACGERWATVRDALQTRGIYEDFMMAQELRDDDSAFVQGYNWAVSEFGAEVVDAVLAAAEGGV